METIQAIWNFFGSLKLETEVALFAATAVGGLFAFFLHDFRNPRSRRWVIQLAEAENRWTAYRNGVRWLVGWADLFYQGRTDDDGTLTYRWRAFDRSLVIAFAYPLFLFLLAWAADGKTTMWGLKFAEDRTPAEQRWLTFGLVVALTAFYFVGRGSVPETARRLTRVLSKYRPERSVFQITVEFVGLAVAVAGAVAVAVAVAGTGAVAFAFAAVFAFSVASACGGAFAFADTGGVSVAVTVVFAVAVAVAVAVAGTSGTEFSTTFIIFLVLLPFTNAVADWGSLHITRRLLGGWLWPRRNQSSPSGCDIFWRLLVDLLVALAALVGLVVLIGVIFEVTNHFLDDPVDWLGEARLARADPLGEGLPITLMLLSTLLPTLFHMVAGTFAMLVVPWPGFAGLWRWAFPPDGDRGNPEDTHDEPFHLGHKIKSTIVLALLLGAAVFLVTFLLHRLLLVFGVLAGEAMPLAGVTGIETLPDLLLWIAESVHRWFSQASPMPYARLSA